MDTSTVDMVAERLTQLRATPLIFNGADDFSSLKVFGFYRNFDIILSLPTVSTMNIEVESFS